MKKVFITILLFVSFAISGMASELQEPVLKVGVAAYPPFVIFNGNGVAGISVDLWNNIADSLKLRYHYVRFTSYLDMMDAMGRDEINLTINPLTMTENRLAQFRLTIPFYTSKLALVERPVSAIPMTTVFLSLINWRTLRLLFVICVTVFIFSLLIWLAERRKNNREFRKGHQGIADGVWWAFVTMTTVGYGDKIPKTRLGRTLTLIWMFFAIALMLLFTAEISSELTITKLQGDIDTVDELRKVKVGTLEQTGFSAFCEINRIQYVPYTDLKEGVDAVSDRKIEAFIGDYATLEYLSETDKLGKSLVINPTSLNEQFFCFGANKNYLRLIDEINPIMLDITESAQWTEILYKNGIRP